MLWGGVGLGNGGQPLRAEINETEQARVMRACFQIALSRSSSARYRSLAPSNQTVAQIWHVRYWIMLPHFFYPIPRPLPQQAREGERAERRWPFMRILVLCCAFIQSFISESPFPSSLGHVDIDLWEGPGMGKNFGERRPVLDADKPYMDCFRIIRASVARYPAWDCLAKRAGHKYGGVLERTRHKRLLSCR